jgi:hypothetical protein
MRGGGESTRHGIRDSATSGIPVRGRYFVTVPYTFDINDISSFALEGYNRRGHGDTFAQL